MALTETQTKSLKAKLKRRHVKLREVLRCLGFVRRRLALAMKVSDEFTVPVCNTHHDQLHRAGDERAFWACQGFGDPLKYAARLWEASRNQRKGVAPPGTGTLDPDLEPEFSEPCLRKGQA